MPDVVVPRLKLLCAGLVSQIPPGEGEGEMGGSAYELSIHGLGQSMAVTYLPRQLGSNVADVLGDVKVSLSTSTESGADSPISIYSQVIKSMIARFTEIYSSLISLP